MATKVKPAAASSKTPPELEEKKSAASDTELKQRGLDDALFTLLKQLSQTALHSTTSLQAVIDVLDKEEYRNIEEVKLITMDHLQEWFKGARKTQDVLLKLFSASGPTPARPSDDIKEFIQSFQKLSTKNKRSVWKEPAPTTFGPADTTNEWFMAHVREWALSWLQNTLQLEDWPSCEEIYLKATPASSCLLSWLKENGITVTCNPRPAWLEDVATLGDAHLSRLANSWVLDTTAYGAIPHAPPLPLEHNIVIKRVKALYEGPIDSSWMSAAIGSEYIRHLEAMSMHWQKLQYQTSELELTGGVLSHVFDSCYAICAPDFLRTTKGVLTTKWRRNIKDPNAAMLDLPATLPDGRLEVEVQLQDHGIVTPSMIIVEDKAADYEFKDFQMDNVSKGDLETALIEAHRSVVAIHKARPLISEKASEICVLAIHTRWPRVWVYGMSMLRDRSTLAYELGKYNLMAPGAGAALRELCFRTLLVVKHNLDVLLDPHNYSPRDPGMPPMDNWGKKDPGSKVSSETSEPKASSTPSKPTKGQAQHGAPSGGKQSVHIEKRVWKLPTRSGEEEEILRELGGRHHFPALLSAAAPEDVPAGAFAMLYYRDRHVTSMDEARVLTSDLAEALHYLHSCGYVHCDVKRPNVRFDGTQAVLIDLDLARRWREGDAPLACTPGTVGWRAPELQGDNPQLTNKVDLYGLGLVLLDELLVLAYPHSAWRVSRFSFDCSFSFLAGFLGPSTGIEAVRLLAELLNKRPSHRPSAEQVLCSPFVRHKEALAERVCQPLAHQKSQSGTTLPTLAIAPTSTPTVAAIANQSDKKTPQLIIYRDPVETPRPVAARPVKENKGKRTALQERPLNRLDGN